MQVSEKLVSTGVIVFFLFLSFAGPISKIVIKACCVRVSLIVDIIENLFFTTDHSIKGAGYNDCVHVKDHLQY
jgi:hypothetical protein